MDTYRERMLTVHLVRLTGGEAILNCCQVGPRSDRLSELGAIVRR